MVLLFLIYAYLSQKDIVVDLKTEVIVDRSVSMSIEFDGVSSFDKALNYKNQVAGNSNSDFNPSGISSWDNSFDFSTLSSGLIISDFQGQSADELRLLYNDSLKNINFILVGDISSAENVYIDTLFVGINPNDFSQRKVIAHLASSQSMSASNVIVKLMRNGRQLSSIVKDLSISSQIEFDIPIDYDGLFSLKIEGDQVMYDNDFLFSIDAFRKTTIAIIDEELNPYLRQVFANSDLFDVHFMNASSLNFALIDRSDVIVLNDVKNLSTGLVSQIESKVLMIIPPMKTISSSYDALLRIQLQPLEDFNRYELILDFAHPIFAGVFKRNSSQNPLPIARPLYNITGNYETIVSLRNGDPFLLRPTDRAHYFFNTQFSDEFSNVGSHAVFLPLLYQIALSSLNSNNKCYFYPNDILFIPVDNNESPPLIIGEDTEVIPEFNPYGSGLAIKIPAHLHSGNYFVLHGADTLMQVAINLPQSESIMEAPTLTELNEAFADYPNLSFQSLNEVSGNLERNQKSRILKYALILILMFLIIETVLHRYLR